jgi:hypothetical protein
VIGIGEVVFDSAVRLFSVGVCIILLAFL